MASGQVDVLGFIGTHRVADALRAVHPRPHRLRCVLGLDAKNPAVVLPCGFVNNLPVAIMFTGGVYDEVSPLRVALAFERATKWHEMHPRGFDADATQSGSGA